MDKDPQYQFHLKLANDYYERGKFEEAMQKYEDAIERNPKSYIAVVGLACTDREWGLKKFAEAEDLHRAKKVEFAKKEFEKAVVVHTTAHKLYLKAIQMKPDHPLAYRELGVFFYKRATSPYSYPYRLDDQKNRQKERDEAIRHLRIVVEKEPTLPFTRRYLGLALFAAGHSAEGRQHLEVYLQGMAEGREHLRKNAARQSPEQREELERRLRTIDKELDEVCEVLGAYLRDLEDRRAAAQKAYDKLLAEEPARAKESDAKKLVDGLNVEILAVQNLLRKYREVESKKPDAEPPKQN